MIPTRDNLDKVMAIIWTKDPGATWYSDLETRCPVVETSKLGSKYPLQPGFAWGPTPEITARQLIKALKL